MSGEGPVDAKASRSQQERSQRVSTGYTLTQQPDPEVLSLRFVKPVRESLMRAKCLTSCRTSLEGCISTDLQESYIVNLYIGKLDDQNRGNYNGLKLVEKKMKVI